MQVVADKIKVLHVLGGLNRGGAETWLMHVLRHIDRDRFQLDFLVHTEEKCAYDDEARELGARIIPNLYPKNPIRYAYNFFRNYRRYGPYDIVHSHVHHYSGFVLFLAKMCGVPKRIAHSHSDTRSVDTETGLFRRTYLKTMERCIKIFATDGLAASQKAAEALYGAEWENDERWRVVYCGIDLSAFKENWNIREARKELCLPDDAFVIGHVGNFNPQKNHAFLIDIFEEVLKKLPNSYLLLVGGGPLRENIEAKVKAKGIENRVIFAGVRDDIPRLMQAMDVFVMPSMYEGLPVVLLEAQASCIPCIISDLITTEADIIKEMVYRMGLQETAYSWSEKIISLKDREKDFNREKFLSIMRNSPFDIENNIIALSDFYSQYL